MNLRFFKYALGHLDTPRNLGRPLCLRTVPRPKTFRVLLIRLPSYIQDTTDFINRLWGAWLLPLPPECLLVTLNFSSLYTNNPHQEGFTAFEEFLDQSVTSSPHCWASPVPPNADLCQHITSSWVPLMAPSYTNLLVGKLEHMSSYEPRMKYLECGRGNIFPYGPMENHSYAPF